MPHLHSNSPKILAATFMLDNAKPDENPSSYHYSNIASKSKAKSMNKNRKENYFAKFTTHGEKRWMLDYYNERSLQQRAALGRELQKRT
jgi:hypothetical protein